MLIFIVNFLLFGLRATAGQIVGFVLSIAGVALTASHGEPLRLLQLEVNFGDALMLLERHRLQRLHGGAAQQAGHPLAEPDDRADRHRLRHDAAVRRRRVRLRRRHPARRDGLGGHRLHGDLPVDPVAGLLHTRRRADRRQPRRPVHQSGADLRHAAVDHHPRRGFPRLPRHRHGAGVRRHLACRDQRAEAG